MISTLKITQMLSLTPHRHADRLLLHIPNSTAYKLPKSLYQRHIT
jgi:hypothetical protein